MYLIDDVTYNHSSMKASNCQTNATTQQLPQTSLTTPPDQRGLVGLTSKLPFSAFNDKQPRDATVRSKAMKTEIGSSACKSYYSINSDIDKQSDPIHCQRSAVADEEDDNRNHDHTHHDHDGSSLEPIVGQVLFKLLH